MNPTNPKNYLDRRTLITGDVNSGKTRLTGSILQQLVEADYSPEIVLLDLAPETLHGIGGKMDVSAADILHLTCPIQPPRLTGRDQHHIQQLAEQNAAAIDPLIEQALACGRTILFVNDASLYLQAGSLERFENLVRAFPTAIINAYQGRSFIPAPFTETERRKVEHLGRICDRILHL